MTDFTTDPVLTWNMKGVSSMAEGDHQGCAAELENALKAFRMVLRRVRATDHDVQQQQQHPQAQQRQHQAQAEDQQMRIPASKIRLQSVALPDFEPPTSSAFRYNTLGLFSKAFVVINDEEGASTMSTDDIMASPGMEHIIPSVILYNMGLSFHRQAMCLGSSVVMGRAYEFYRHSMALLDRAIADRQRHEPHMPVSKERVLMAALANNMAHISASFFHHQSTRSSMEFLRDILDEMSAENMDLDHEDGESSCMEEEEEDILTMNWIFYSECQLHMLAAAA